MKYRVNWLKFVQTDITMTKDTIRIFKETKNIADELEVDLKQLRKAHGQINSANS